jgi:hypothetical protein
MNKMEATVLDKSSKTSTLTRMLPLKLFQMRAMGNFSLIQSPIHVNRLTRRSRKEWIKLCAFRAHLKCEFLATLFWALELLLTCYFNQNATRSIYQANLWSAPMIIKTTWLKIMANKLFLKYFR